MDVVEDLVLLATVAVGFAAWMVGTGRMFRWFVDPARWRGPTFTEPL